MSRSIHNGNDVGAGCYEHFSGVLSIVSHTLLSIYLTFLAYNNVLHVKTHLLSLGAIPLQDYSKTAIPANAFPNLTPDKL